MFFWIFRSIVVPLTRLFFRTSVRGSENVPLTGPVMLVANHQSNLDPVFLATGNPRRLFAMGKAELFVNPVSRLFYMGLGARPIKRGEPDRTGLKTILDLFYTGNVVILFPEGGRNHEPGLGPLEPGVIFIGDLTGVPILPAGISGSGKIWPKGNKVPRLPKVRVMFGRPFYLKDAVPPASSQAEKKKRNETALKFIGDQIKALTPDAF
ncbi:MAG: lysophospholipid acyltransferase family protein [Actinomycetota bacterium]